MRQLRSKIGVCLLLGSAVFSLAVGCDSTDSKGGDDDIQQGHHAGAGVHAEDLRPPPLTGLPIRLAVRQLQNSDYELVAKGSGYVYRACPPPGHFEEGDTVYLVGIESTAQERRSITRSCLRQSKS
jgi:hypothetical protein